MLSSEILKFEKKKQKSHPTAVLITSHLLTCHKERKKSTKNQDLPSLKKENEPRRYIDQILSIQKSALKFK